MRAMASDRAVDRTVGPWDKALVAMVPRVFDAPSSGVDGVRALFFDGQPWKGRPTRVFAYTGAPSVRGGERVPAMVLVHGGGGSAFIPWVRLWVSRGYAAIAMDTCGCVSSGGFRNHPRHEQGGPPGWGGFDQVEEPLTDQWPYHAVADVILAHSLIRSFPEVDPDRTGITGLSWGGYLTCLAVAADPRFQFAAPVYGCGFLGDNSVWLPEFQKMGTDRSRKWLDWWDPSAYLARVRTPLLWVTGTTDFAYPMDSLQKSYRLPPAPRTLCVRVDMPHGHGGPGENPDEIRVLADARFKGGPGLARITGQGRTERDAWASYDGPEPIVRAELNVTSDRGAWQQRKWRSCEADLDAPRRRVSARLPAGTAVYYFNLIDAGGRVVSSEHEELPATDCHGRMPVPP